MKERTHHATWGNLGSRRIGCGWPRDEVRFGRNQWFRRDNIARVTRSFWERFVS